MGVGDNLSSLSHAVADPVDGSPFARNIEFMNCKFLTTEKKRKKTELTGNMLSEHKGAYKATGMN